MIPALITFAVVTLIYGVISYVIAKDDAAKEKGRNVMIYGIVGLFVIVAMWGLVAVLRNTFLGGQNGSLQTNQIPCVPGTGQIGC
jgi:multisubunit Na+/H+ antiporter MnhB subunit